MEMKHYYSFHSFFTNLFFYIFQMGVLIKVTFLAFKIHLKKD